MDIKTNLKDYSVSHKQRVFAGYLKEQASSTSCSEKITNKDYLRKYFSPDHDFLIYSTAVANPAQLLHKKVI